MEAQIWPHSDILSLPHKRKCDWLKPPNMEIENNSNTALRNTAVEALPRKQALLNIIVAALHIATKVKIPPAIRLISEIAAARS